MVLLAGFLGWMFDGMEMGIFPLVARPALQQMQLLSGAIEEGFVQHWMGIITGLFLLGAACGGLIFGWIGDRVGRVKAMTWSILCYSLFTGLCYFAAQPWQLGACRFVAALGMGGEWGLGVALVMEVWPENKRPLMAGLIGAAANLPGGVVARERHAESSARLVVRRSRRSGLPTPRLGSTSSAQDRAATA